jgi:hypothetical protein
MWCREYLDVQVACHSEAHEQKEERRTAYLDLSLSAGVALACLRHDGLNKVSIAFKHINISNMRLPARLVVGCLLLTLRAVSRSGCELRESETLGLKRTSTTYRKDDLLQNEQTVHTFESTK